MANSRVLTVGAIDKILDAKYMEVPPIVQILDAVKLPTNDINVTLFDGVKTYQHCTFTSDEAKMLFENGQLKFTVVRLGNHFTWLPEKAKIRIIRVSHFTVIKLGSEINHQLAAGEPVDAFAGPSTEPF